MKLLPATLLMILVIAENILPCQQTKPILQYDCNTKQLTVTHTQNDDKKICKTPINHAIFHHIQDYQLNSQNNYLCVNANQQEQPKDILAISILKRLAPQISDTLDTVQKMVPSNSGKRPVTKIIDLDSFTEILSLPEHCITHTFSPNSKRIVIALPQKKEPSVYGIGAPGKRIASQDGKVLCHHLYDIKTKELLATFENIQALQFDTDDMLTVKYDNEKYESITVTQDEQLSFMEAMHKMIRRAALIKVIAKEIEPQTMGTIAYDLYSQKLTITALNDVQKEYSNIMSYTLSPKKLYVLIHQQSQNALKLLLDSHVTGRTTLANITTIVCLRTGREMLVGNSGPIITSEFNPEETSLLLLITSPQNTPISLCLPGELTYHVFDLNTGALSKPIKNCQAAYFASQNKIIYFESDGTKQQLLLNPQSENPIIVEIEDEESSEYEDITVLMRTFIRNQNKDHVEKIKADIAISDVDDVKNLLTEHSRYDQALQKTFAQLFFDTAQENRPNKSAPNTVCVKAQNGKLYQFSLDPHTYQIAAQSTASNQTTAPEKNMKVLEERKNDPVPFAQLVMCLSIVCGLLVIMAKLGIAA